ncbi:MAG: tRNA (guanosine(37)-N1)-methyltransferase TrmD [Betaproteobacteria bacterium]|nr:MAG: tRNA (guanosine(37)-N1)-methyltransferase TrmD [Betaproteobacteria bacterium]
MRIDIISVLPSLLDSFLHHSIVQRAQDKGLVELAIHNLRDYSGSKHRTVDDYAFGGGAGMVLMIEPVVNCLEFLKNEREYQEIIYVSPDGRPFHQAVANELSLLENIIIICGHYKGIDERFREHFVTREISIGDYVLSGGELPAAVLSDAVIRLLPGVLSNESSALSDSFQDGLVAPPVYTRPARFRGIEVPAVLLSGHEKEIEKWRFEQSVKRTQERRPDKGNTE